MSTVKVRALDSCDQYRPGDVWDTSERLAQELEKKGLVKIVGTPPAAPTPPAPRKTKVMPDPTTATPAAGAGVAAPLSASQAAQVSAPTTQRASPRGKPPSRRRGR